ncbi:MAG: type VI secretion system tip protein VgrG [Sandaracinaceae bacterium]|nr:type VI secretion system tip protein VgrG [Sandaracinaceae bacterium]
MEARFEAERWDGPEWIVVGATVEERLNEPYRVALDVALPAGELDGSVLLGSSAVLTLVRREVALRVCGVVTMVREGTDEAQRTQLALHLEPALVALRHRTDSRIFQNLTVPAIVEQVLGGPLGAFGRALESRLEGSYPAREYVVQYHETDFDFAHRLMEEEGIGYCFEHDGDAERLVLFDRPAHHLAIEAEGGSAVRYVGRFDEELESAEGVASFESVSRLRPNRVVARHFDWTHPSVAIEAAAEVPDAAWPALEAYVHDAPLTFHGYDHTYGAHNMADQLRVATERVRRDAWLAEGVGSSLAMRAGRRFELVEHPRVDLDGEWTLVATEHRYLEHAREHGAGGYVNRFECLPASVPWRPDRLRPTPRIVGVQTATVVGPAGEEIHCDPHGRVKVHFHWDRLGARDDHDSCWIRVMQTMGGPGWGFAFIPRIGMEVVVTFVEGDPSQPLITGTVYNGESPPPYDFPADKTRTTIKTNSSPGGGGFNELRFEDRAGSEEIWLQGEKDWNTLIKNDLTRRVGHDETQEVVHDRVRLVGHDEQITIQNDQRKRVDHDERDSVGHDRIRDVGHDEQVTIGSDQTLRVGRDETVTIGNDETVSVGNDSKQKIGSNLLQNIGKNLTQQVLMNAIQNVGMNALRSVVGSDTQKVGGEALLQIGTTLTQKVGVDLIQKIKGALSTTVGGGYALDVTGDFTQKITGDCKWDVAAAAAEEGEGGDGGGGEGAEGGGEESAPAGGNISWTAEETITFTCGDASITLLKDGTVQIKGTSIFVDSEGDVEVNGETIFLN